MAMGKRLGNTVLMIAAVIIMIFMVNISFCFADSSVHYNGDLGTGVQWTLDGTTLTLTGSGEIPNYGAGSMQPWCVFDGAITMYAIDTVVISNGITRIGDYAFHKLTYGPNYKKFVLPDSIQEIVSI